MHAYKQKDPPVLPQLAVPLELIIAARDLLPKRGQQYKRAAQLIIIAYFYLLRVGEYTKPRKQTRTVQFRFKDVLFWKDGISLDPRTSSPETLRTADAATLRIMNQKNGVKNQTIHHERAKNKSSMCPVETLIELIIELKNSLAEDETLLCAYRMDQEWQHIQDRHITSLVKWLAKKTKLTTKGYPESRLGSHSLRAGGAMALKLNGVDAVLIKKYGRWTSDTFITYIHEQIAHLAAGVSSAMATQLLFYNVVGFTD